MSTKYQLVLLGVLTAAAGIYVTWSWNDARGEEAEARRREEERLREARARRDEITRGGFFTWGPIERKEEEVARLMRREEEEDQKRKMRKRHSHWEKNARKYLDEVETFVREMEDYYAEVNGRGFLCVIDEIEVERANFPRRWTFEYLVNRFGKNRFRLHRNGTLLIELLRKTPHVGLDTRRRYFGTFQCHKCRRWWCSAGAWVNEWQMCNKQAGDDKEKPCDTKVYPWKLEELRWGGDRSKARQSDKKHEEGRCGKCRKLGYLCIKEPQPDE